MPSVSQSTWTVGAIFLMFFAWIASRGQLPTYMSLFGLTGGQSAAQAATSASATPGASANTIALGKLDPTSAALGTAVGQAVNTQLQPGTPGNATTNDNLFDPNGYY